VDGMKIPLFPLDLVLFPGVPLPLHIFEPRYRQMAAECLATSAPFGIVRARPEGLAVIGCTARIVRILHRYPDGRSDILTQGIDRFEIEQLIGQGGDASSYLEAEIDLSLISLLLLCRQILTFVSSSWSSAPTQPAPKYC
jgi:Lon protease-like protein